MGVARGGQSSCRAAAPCPLLCRARSAGVLRFVRSRLPTSRSASSLVGTPSPVPAGPPLRGTRRQPPPPAGACAGASLGTAAAAHSSRPVLRARDPSGAGVPRARSLAPASSPPPRPRRGEQVRRGQTRPPVGGSAGCLPRLRAPQPRRCGRAAPENPPRPVREPSMPRHGTRTCRAQPAVPAA